MARRVSFSGENLSLSEAALHYDDTKTALELFFSSASPLFTVRFAGYKSEEVRDELKKRLAELELTTTMSLLAAVEAAFRIDYLQRCYRRKRDSVSPQFRVVFKKKETRPSLEDDIFEIWKNNTVGSTELISGLRSAFRFRHWIAHGRYWTPKLGQKHNYLSVYSLSLQAVSSFPLLTPS